MSVLKKTLESGRFAVTAEMATPKGSNFLPLIAAASSLQGKIHCVNVTDMQSACLKASSIGLCIRLKQYGIEPILQMTGRDRNRMAIMAEYFTAASFGIDTTLALTGDHTTIGDCKDAKPVFDLDSVGILQMLSDMEATGKDCGGNDIEGTVPKFYKGAAVTPVYEPLFLQINKLKQKVDAGAKFVQTQGIFEVDQLKRFVDEVNKENIDVYIMAGIIPLKTAGMAKYMNSSVPGIAVPSYQIEKLAQATQEGKEKGIKGLATKVGMEMAAEMIAKIKDEKLCAGVHIMSIGAEENVGPILDMSGVKIKPEELV